MLAAAADGAPSTILARRTGGGEMLIVVGVRPAADLDRDSRV